MDTDMLYTVVTCAATCPPISSLVLVNQPSMQCKEEVGINTSVCLRLIQILTTADSN